MKDGTRLSLRKCFDGLCCGNFWDFVLFVIVGSYLENMVFENYFDRYKNFVEQNLGDF